MKRTYALLLAAGVAVIPGAALAMDSMTPAPHPMKTGATKPSSMKKHPHDTMKHAPAPKPSP